MPSMLSYSSSLTYAPISAIFLILPRQPLPFTNTFSLRIPLVHLLHVHHDERVDFRVLLLIEAAVGE